MTDFSYTSKQRKDILEAIPLNGAAAADAIVELLPTMETLTQAGRLGRLGEICECRALLARALGDEAEYRRQLGLALETYLVI